MFIHHNIRSSRCNRRCIDIFYKCSVQTKADLLLHVDSYNLASLWRQLNLVFAHRKQLCKSQFLDRIQQIVSFSWNYEDTQHNALHEIIRQHFLSWLAPLFHSCHSRSDWCYFLSADRLVERPMRLLIAYYFRSNSHRAIFVTLRRNHFQLNLLEPGTFCSNNLCPEVLSELALPQYE